MKVKDIGKAIGEFELNNIPKLIKAMFNKIIFLLEVILVLIISGFLYLDSKLIMKYWYIPIIFFILAGAGLVGHEVFLSKNQSQVDATNLSLQPQSVKNDLLDPSQGDVLALPWSEYVTAAGLGRADAKAWLAHQESLKGEAAATVQNKEFLGDLGKAFFIYLVIFGGYLIVRTVVKKLADWMEVDA